MNLEFVPAVLTATASIILGAFALIRNPKITINRLFAIFTAAVSLWVASSYFSNADVIGHQLFFNRVAYTTALAVTVSLLAFSWYFPTQIKKTSAQRIAVVLSPIFFVLTITPLVVASYRARPNESVTDIQGGPLYLMILAYIILLFAFVAKNFYRSYKSAGASDKSQIKLVAFGIGVVFVWVALTAALIPYFTGNWSLAIYGPTSIIILTSSIGYSIIKHKLFDIRLVVARSLGYILTLTTLVGIYVVVIFGLSASILGTGSLGGAQQAIYIGATLVFGFSLTPLKRFFDRLTNKLFYRDAYDAQVLLDQLNKVLVGNIDLEPLLRIAAELVGTTLKAEYCVFIIHETDDTPRRVVGIRKAEFDDAEVINLHIHRHIKDPQVVTDELEEVDSRIKDVLTKNNISIVSRLAATSGHKEEQGYLILGNKQSGNPYNKQDLQVLDIIANELVIAIQNAMRFEEIQTFNVTLQQKVNDATKQLRKTNEKLKALDETKDEFISMASHQLRTPLTSVKGYVSMVLDGDVGSLKPKQEELLNQAFASSQRMVYLIADLLNVSRLRTGKFVIENKPTQLADVVETEMGQLTEMAKGKQQTLTYTKPKNFPELMLDETKIRQVIMNFADNALHYTQNGGHIQINLVDKGDTIEYTVVDDGLGVPKAEQHHLFTKFFRAGNARKARPDGTGLGLFMAKKVIIAQGGAVIFSSEEGKGSTFGFTFSKAKLQKQPKTITKLASSAEEPKQPVDTLTPETTPKPVAAEADKKPAQK